MGRHPVAVVQYTYTHKQYRKRHKTNNTKNTKIHRTTQKILRATQQLGRVRAVPRLCGFYTGICLTAEEKARKNLSQGMIYDMICLTAIGLTPVAVVQYTFTHKQYIEQHNRHKQYIEQHSSLIRKTTDRAPSLRDIPWHLPYN